MPVSKTVEIRNAVLIAGPTAGGKSAMALERAHRSGGIIINADSMQVYSGLRLLTARPSAKDRASAPHELYGHVRPDTPYSTGVWLREVARLAETGVFETQPAIFVGGTGLYFRALLGGLAPMPSVPDVVRAHWRERLREEGATALHGILAHNDPETAARLHATDGQRIARALEVLEATGKPITHWQRHKTPSLVDPETATKIIVEPDRQHLAARIDARLRAMVSQGVLDEVEALRALDLDPMLPAMKAIGVGAFSSHLDGEITLEDAMAMTATQTRQYAKRQSTWFRNQVEDDWIRTTGESPF